MRGPTPGTNDVDVLVVGGGPVGLTLALELGRQGVRTRLIDKRPAPGKLPKMERCNARTMENYRRLGIADRIRAAGLAGDVPMDVFICWGDLTNPPLVHHEYPSVSAMQGTVADSHDGTLPAEPYQLISQYTLEPLLMEVLGETDGVEVVPACELVSFEEVDGGVVATVDHRGVEEQIRASYLVGCDGGSSVVRRRLGIELRGESLLQMRQALFYSEDLFERIPIGKGRHYHFADQEHSFLIVQDDKKHFSLHARVETDEEMPALFERILGFDVDYETLYVGTWQQRLMVADAYRSGRVLMAGDAVHLVIPTGGLGMNTGAGDAVDLAWKLAGTVHGWGGPGLLDSYEAERRPIGLRNVAASRKAASGRRTWRAEWTPEIAERSEAGDRARARLAEVADREQRWSNDLYGIELGYRYDGSPLIVPEDGGDQQPPDANSFQYTPTTWPGARLPHVWAEPGVAVQDLVGKEYALLRVGAATGVDAAPFAAAYGEFGAPFSVVDLTGEDARAVYGEGLLLVRPDLHVAWRGPSLPDDVGTVVRRSLGRAER
ncbi:FAD-dependent monooxygenase [Georgenia alba]|uniref:FAD-dependent monooxygenase n=1 Tax=Georgenia alba TaxID=2233858 RepID=A0ABW2QAF6_9MICO